MQVFWKAPPPSWATVMDHPDFRLTVFSVVLGVTLTSVIAAVVWVVRVGRDRRRARKHQEAIRAALGLPEYSLLIVPDYNIGSGYYVGVDDSDVPMSITEIAKSSEQHRTILARAYFRVTNLSTRQVAITGCQIRNPHPFRSVFFRPWLWSPITVMLCDADNPSVAIIGSNARIASGSSPTTVAVQFRTRVAHAWAHQKRLFRFTDSFNITHDVEVALVFVDRQSPWRHRLVEYYGGMPLY